MQGGVVVKVTEEPVFGRVVVVDEGNGVQRKYAHLSRFADLRPGQEVSPGSVLAYSGGAQGTEGSGNSTGPHLHITKTVGGRAVDLTPELALSDKGSAGKAARRAGGVDAWRPYVEKWAPEFGVPVDVAMAVLQQESGGNPRARSGAGAVGLMQLMPGTARSLGVDPTKPLENLRGGLKYLGQQYERFGNWSQALAAYNAGPKRAADGSWTKIAETRRYVSAILRASGGGAGAGAGASGELASARKSGPEAYGASSASSAYGTEFSNDPAVRQVMPLPDVSTADLWNPLGVADAQGMPAIPDVSSGDLYNPLAPGGMSDAAAT